MAGWDRFGGNPEKTEEIQPEEIFLEDDEYAYFSMNAGEVNYLINEIADLALQELSVSPAIADLSKYVFRMGRNFEKSLKEMKNDG